MDLEYLASNERDEDISPFKPGMIALFLALPDNALREVVRMAITACADRVFENDYDYSDEEEDADDLARQLHRFENDDEDDEDIEEFARQLREVCRAFERSVNNLEPGS